MTPPVRDDVVELEYHRKPAPYELKFGWGAIHYATFVIEECCHPSTRIPKKWFISKRDGLRYYR